jgi:hypothetical protein
MIRRRFSILVERVGDDPPPAEVELRRLLKLLLRGMQMRCIDVRETRPCTDAVSVRSTDRVSQARRGRR